MSLNQSRVERSDTYNRKPGRSSGTQYQRSFQYTPVGKGGAVSSGLPSPSSNSSLAVANANRSLKKNNGQGGQLRADDAATNLEIHTSRVVQNGNVSQTQQGDSPLSGSGLATSGVLKHIDSSTQRSEDPLPHPPPSSSSVRPPMSTSRGSSKTHPFQFGTINPGFMNGIEIPARTSSAPPKLDEQKRDQELHDTGLNPVPTIVAAQQLQKQQSQQQKLRKDPGVKVSNVTEASQASHQREDVAKLRIPVPTQNTTAKPSVLNPIGGSVSVPFQQTQPPVQFSNTNAQNSHNVSSGALQMPMPLSGGIVAPVQPPVFVHSLQSHPLQAQGVIHQSPGLAYGPQVNPQNVPQLGSLNISMTPQFPQSAVNKFCTTRKTVKITDPKTREELKLDKKIDPFLDPSSLGQVVQLISSPSAMPLQSQQPITSFPSAHQFGYFPSMQPNTYTPIFLSGHTAHPLSTAQVAPGSSAPRYNYPVHHGGVPVSVTNHAAHFTSSPAKPGNPSNLDSVNSEAVAGKFASVNITTKPPAFPIPAKSVSSNSALFPNLSSANTGVLQSEPIKLSMKYEESGSQHLQRPTDGAGLISSATGEIQTQLLPSVSSIGPSGMGPSISGREPKHVIRPPSILSPLHVDDPISAGVTDEPRQVSVVSSPQHVVISVEPLHALTNSDNGRKWDSLKRSDSLTDHQILKREEQRQPVLSNQVYGSACNLQLSVSELAKNGDMKSGHSSQIQDSRQSVSNGFPHHTLPSSSSLKFENKSSSEGLVSEIKDGERGPGEPSCSADSEVTKKTTPERFFSSSSLTSESVPPYDPNTGTELDNTTPYGETRTKLHNDIKLRNQESFYTPNGCPDNSNCFGATLGDESMIDREDKRCQIVLSDQFVLEQENIATEEVSTSFMAHDDEIVRNGINRKGVLSDSAVTSPACSNSGQVEDSSSLHLVVDGNGKCMERQSFDEKSRSPEEWAESDRGLPEEVVQKCETRGGTESRWFVSTSSTLSSPKEKIILDHGKLKNVSGKMKKRELLSKEDAAVTASEFYMAHKIPERKRGLARSETAETLSSSNDKQMSVGEAENLFSAKERENRSRSELFDHEEASGMSSPQLKVLEKSKQIHSHEHHNGGSVGRKRYTRDFLMTFSELYTMLPPGFEIGMDIAGLVMSVQVHVLARGNERILDRHPSGSSRPGRRGSARGDLAYGVPIGGLRPSQGGNIGVLKNPRGQTTGQYVSGIFSGPMQPLASLDGFPRPNADSDRWQHTVPIPVQKGSSPSHTQSVIMHKAERRYEVGKISDQEETKQRQLKGILNKLTPQNFEKLFQQVKEVAIDNVVTLTGVISQIFDKALMEPTFCEMYADFCLHLAGALPDLMEDNEKITFRRLLLNKCQEEFERGEREQAEADKVGEEGEMMQSIEEREEKRIKVRRRMLGNIRLIGELYKKKMLTERIMHECIKKLLGQYENPDEEDVEALCKLMSTIGAIIDHSVAKDHVDAYFDRIQKLSTNQKLSSRVRFMLRDTIDLRKNNWQQRRKIEGPKKIEEVHRDAAQERQTQAGRTSRASSVSFSRRGHAVDYGPRGSLGLPSPAGHQTGSIRGMTSGRIVTQDVRLGDRHIHGIKTSSLPLSERSSDDDSLTLGPEGGLKVASMRGHPSAPSGPTNNPVTSTGNARKLPISINSSGSAYSGEDHTSYCSREEVTSRDEANSQNISASRHNSSDKLSEEHLKEKSMSAIKEFYSADDEEEVASCMKDLNAASFYPSVVSLWVTDSFERKDMERDRLSKLLVFLCKSRNNLLSQVQLVKGLEFVFSILPEALYDAPKASEFLGNILAKVILENIVTLEEIGRLIREGGEEPGSLTESGIAADVLGTIFEVIKKEKGDVVLNEIRRASGFRLEDFLPPSPKSQSKLLAFA